MAWLVSLLESWTSWYILSFWLLDHSFQVDSPINATDGEVSNALMQDSEAKIGEFRCFNDGLHQSLVDDDFSPLCGKPYYNCIVTKTHLHKQYQMVNTPTR